MRGLIGIATAFLMKRGKSSLHKLSVMPLPSVFSVISHPPTLIGNSLTVARTYLTYCEYRRPIIYLSLLGIGFTPSPFSIATN